MNMLESLKEETNLTQTENGAITFSSTGSDCLDLFSTIGALRSAKASEILARFIKAFTENPDLAMKILFFSRDIRGGLGERKVFRTIMHFLADTKLQTVKKNLQFFAEFGRYDDLLCLLGTDCEKAMLEYIKVQFESDLAFLESGENVSLLGKWLPSINASNAETIRNAKKIARFLGMSDAKYRKSVTALRAKIKIIENNLRTKDYCFDYEGQPSRALFKYKSAFLRNDKERYSQFLKNVSNGTAKLNASNVYPYELVQSYLQFDSYSWFMKRSTMTDAEKEVLNATWNALPDFGGKENMLAIVDTSGSMYSPTNPRPISVAFSLGIYFAERNKGAFANHFIEFSENPQLLQIKGKTFTEKLDYLSTFNKVANTNIEAVFRTVLNAAIKNKVSQEELPQKLVIISDMEFDSCVENKELSNFENAKKMFEENGYKLPEIIFWNVASRALQVPVKKNEQGVALVSGITPRLFEMVASGIISPLVFMQEVLQSPRYEKIGA